MKFDFIFVVLVYRNTSDLKDFFKSLMIKNCKVLVINSFYDEDTKNEFESIAKLNNADFINIENKGYGYGNNRGCEYALNHYDFKYLIISNADIEIKKLDVSQLTDKCITSPEITTLKNKYQNPYRPYEIKILDKIQYYGYIKDYHFLILLVSFFTKLTRIFFRLFIKKGQIYGTHGAFIIIPKHILEKTYPIYNEKMFLFAEEEHFSKKMKNNGIGIQFNPKITINHKEDGSTSSINTYKETKKSFIEYYSFWYKK